MNDAAAMLLIIGLFAALAAVYFIVPWVISHLFGAGEDAIRNAWANRKSKQLEAQGMDTGLLISRYVGQDALPPELLAIAEQVARHQISEEEARAHVAKHKGALGNNSSAHPCPCCGNPVNPAMQFCNKCGTSLCEQPAPANEASCPRCGNMIAAGKRFCNKCGSPLEPEGHPAQEPPVQADVVQEPPVQADVAQEPASLLVDESLVPQPVQTWPQQAACQHCGSPLPEGAKFCGECGAAASQAALACASCGSPLQGTEKFCGCCGASV